MVEEIFGPVLTIHVYDDASADAFEKVLDLVDSTSEYALTGAVPPTTDTPWTSSKKLENAAGNFYLNDKPTGAVVRQQPFENAVQNQRQGRILPQPPSVGESSNHQRSVGVSHQLPLPLLGLTQEHLDTKRDASASLFLDLNPLHQSSSSG